MILKFVKPVARFLLCADCLLCVAAEGFPIMMMMIIVMRPPFSPAFPTMCLCGVRIAGITFIASITCLEAALFVVNSDHQSRVMKN